MSHRRAVRAVPPDHRNGPLLVLTAAVLWSTTGIAGELLSDTNPTTIAALRLVLGSAVLSLTALLPGSVGAGWRSRPGTDRLLVVLAGCCTAAFQLLFFHAVRLAGAATGTLVTSVCAPVFAALIDRAFRGERPAATWYAGTGLAAVGVAVLCWPSGGEPVRVTGLVLAALCGGCYAGFSGCSGTLARRGVPLGAVVRTSLGIGAVFLLPALFGAAPGTLSGTRTVLVLAWLGVIGTALPYLAFVGGLRSSPPRTAATLGTAQPLAAAVLAVLVLDEALTWRLVVAAALVVCGLVVVAAPRRWHPGPRRHALPQASSTSAATGR